MNLQTCEREQYQPDGNMRWSRLPLLLLIPLATAIALATLMSCLLVRGWYLLAVTALVMSILVSLCVYGAVHVSHCRMPLFALALGFLSGLTTYLGFYQITMAQTIGRHALTRIDWLPGYIAFRMRNDAHVRFGLGGVRPPKPNQTMNWLAFLFEGSLVVGSATAAGHRAAMRGYDSQQQKWCARELMRFELGTSQALAEALASDEIALFCESHRPIMVQENVPSCKISLEYTLDPSVSPLDRPIYLSAEEASRFAWFKRIIYRKEALIQRRIRRVEALEFQSMFPNFSRIAQQHHPELASQPRNVVGQATGLQLDATKTAIITPIADRDRCHIFGPKHLAIEKLCQVMPAVGVAAGGGIIYLGSMLFGLETPAGCAGMILGAGMILVSIYLALWSPHTIGVLYQQSVVGKQISRRAPALVQRDEADSFFVTITRRENWQKVRLTQSTDAGFAKIDLSSRRLNLECDANRYEIPLDSIVSVSAEPFVSRDNPTTRFWMICLVIQIPEGTDELIFCDAGASFLPGKEKRQMRANQRRITALVGHGVNLA